MKAYVGKNWKALIAFPAFLGMCAVYVALAAHFFNSAPPVRGTGNVISVVSPVTDSQGNGPITLYPCSTEDSDNCYRLFGGRDGVGKSFVVIDGKTYYLAG